MSKFIEIAVIRAIQKATDCLSNPQVTPEEIRAAKAHLQAVLHIVKGVA